MKTMIRVLLLGSFAATAVFAIVGGYDYLVALGFLMMFVLVGINFFYVYGIRTETVAKMLGEDEQVGFSASASRLISLADAGRPRAQAASERGRLVVTTEALRFLCKKEGKILQTFALPLDQVTGAGLGQVLSNQQGLIITGTKNREAHFSIFGMGKKFDHFKQALGWQ